MIFLKSIYSISFKTVLNGLIEIMMPQWLLFLCTLQWMDCEFIRIFQKVWLKSIREIVLWFYLHLLFDFDAMRLWIHTKLSHPILCEVNTFFELRESSCCIRNLIKIGCDLFNANNKRSHVIGINSIQSWNLFISPIKHCKYWRKNTFLLMMWNFDSFLFIWNFQFSYPTTTPSQLCFSWFLEIVQLYAKYQKSKSFCKNVERFFSFRIYRLFTSFISDRRKNEFNSVVFLLFCSTEINQQKHSRNHFFLCRL